ncbi:PilZ domain-containing protein [Rhizobium sp. KVB221]|uniref:PilZ domain-containing protein n=1 Tax=Rhizobium setariae TaxID=2801340 RepID=A0A936YKM8_9HYPH|nr:PilZ domain-containing protein [Rhizobium setariae]MBL0371328.1 PilZ domain-containing protein [Rhizobium setariae]
MLHTVKQVPFRTDERSKVRIFGVVKVMNETSRARVVDISASGMALDLETPIKVTPSQIITFESEELGRLSGVVRWCRDSRIGIEYKLTTTALAQISAYFRFFHEEVKPVLRG